MMENRLYDGIRNTGRMAVRFCKTTADKAAHVKLGRREWILIAAAAAVAAGVLFWVFRPRPAAPFLPTVAVEPVATDDVSIYGDYVGRIRAQQTVEIRARVEGYLERCSSPKAPM